MSHVGIFLNTAVDSAGSLAKVGNWGLTPVRYLFGGRSVEISDLRNPQVNSERCYEEWTFEGFLLAALLLIPGLALSFFKLLSYGFSDECQRHSLTKLHFTPIDRAIGSIYDPVMNEADLEEALGREADAPLHQRTGTLTIYGTNGLTIGNDWSYVIEKINPMKLILVGIDLEPFSNFPNLDSGMHRSGKWERAPQPGSGETQTLVHEVSSVEEARQTKAHRRGIFSSKRYHQVFQVIEAQA